MTVKQLKKLLKGMPDYIDVAIEISEESIMPICPTDSGVVGIEFNDTGEKRLVFVLCPCSCDPLGMETEMPENKRSIHQFTPENKN